MECPQDNHHDVSGTSVLIIGAGRFGARAARILSAAPHRPAVILVLDREAARLEALQDLCVETRIGDGIDLLIGNDPSLDPSSIIVPAVPLHLAFAWLKAYLYGKYDVRPLPVPRELHSQLPFTWPGNGDDLLVSYADFICPDDCPEPSDHCTVTGKRREVPLFGLLSQLEVPGYCVHIIRSRQLAPGVGGYPLGELWALRKKVMDAGGGRWLIGTACRCHGTLSAIDLALPGQNEIPLA